MPQQSSLLKKPQPPVVNNRPRRWLAPAVGTVLALSLLGVAVNSGAFAQTYSVAQLTNTIRSIDRNRDFRNLGANTRRANSLSQTLERAEVEFVQSGCQAVLNRGDRLSRECRTVARTIINGRRDMEALQTRIATGQSLARQREQFTQQLASRGNSGSQANVQTQQRPSNIFEQLFNSLAGNTPQSGGIIVEENSGFASLGTVRSVCVRKSDGYFWPVSFSTVTDNLPNDALQCQPPCPGVEVELYYYSNPGQEPKDMVNLAGQRYAALPTAFAYRENYDVANSCRTNVSFGSIEIVETQSGPRTFINIDQRSVALPLRDPRRKVDTVVVVAEAVNITLPRPRPNPQGSGPNQPGTVLSADLRIYEINGRVVRIVGPDTPYAPTGAEDS